MVLEKKIEIRPGDEYIKLGALLKFAGIIEKGSNEKVFLFENAVTVNGVPENRRGAKIRPGDKVIIAENLLLTVCNSKN